MDGAGAAALELARLVQRLAGSNVRLHLVTEGATWGHSDGSEINFNAAAVWALGRSLITERPVAISGMTDLEPGTPVAAALGQIGADLRIASEEVAWRGLDRFEHRLQPRPLQQLCERSAPTAQVEGYALSIGERKGFEGLRWRRRAPPQPGVGQMTIAVEACGVNFRDVLKVLDVYPLGRSEWRWLGDEFAGRVHEVGPGVEGFAAGDLVVGVAPDCMASHVLADARLVARCPPSLSPELAAGVPIAFLTAWYSLVECGRLKRGETVLIHAAAGGVGQAAIQIARHLGARVLATASPAKQALVASLGADAVFNSRDLSFAEAARGATSGEGVDLVLNSLAGDALIHSVDLLKPFGRFIELGKRDIFANRPLDLRSLRDNRRFFTVDLASWMMRSPEEAGRQLGEVLQLIERGELRPVETHVLPIRTAAETFRGMAQGQHTGKLVLRVQGETAPLRVGDPEAKIVRPDATYLITGGTSGLGLVVARFLAKAGARHLVLSSRSGNVAESDAPVLDEILNYGATVHLRACDIGDVRATKGLLAEIRRDLPPLRGVVHGAMVLDDVDILGLDLARLDRVLRPKAMGAWNLSVLTEGDGLDWFLMHGSVSAMLGAAGQSNYVVANHLLEALVAHRQRRGLPAQTVAWGPIASAGVVARSDQLRRYFELLGFTRLTNDSIEDALNHLLCSDESAIAVCGVDWVRLSAALPGFESDKRFRHLLDAARENDGGTNMAEMLNTLDVAGRRELVANLIVVQTATVLGIQTAQVPRDRPLGDLGLDSLMAFELSATLEANLGKRLPISTLQGNRTVDELADRISRVFAGNGEIPPEQQSASSQSGVAAAGKAAGVRLRFLAPRSLADPDMRFEAAALTYIPEDFITRGNLGTTELRAAFGAEPFLSCVIDGPIGRVGAFMLPVRGRDLFSEPSRTRELVYRSMQLAQSQGSRVMTLTGLLPAATDYGQALGLNNGHAMDMAVTTGHALTTATIVANLADLLQRCGRQVEGEEISIVGLGSVGRSVLELLLRSLPHPRKLVLCDRYAKVSDLEVLRRQIRAKHNFDGPIDLVAGDNGLPEEVLGTKLIVSAVDRTGLIDPMRLGSGTILLDDSYPPAFELKTAWRRMEEGQDVVIASGGFARLSGVVQETLYVPDSARGFLDSYGEENFLRLFEREACDYTACVFAGPLSLRDPALHPALGIPTAEALEAFHAALDRHRIGSAKPHCGGQLLPESLFVKMRDIQKLPEGSRPEFRI
ncbi:MAG: SDR family NAD(P)-dependent oxidoreductase [Xanthobacteraceae bacterium]